MSWTEEYAGTVVRVMDITALDAIYAEQYGEEEGLGDELMCNGYDVKGLLFAYDGDGAEEDCFKDRDKVKDTNTQVRVGYACGGRLYDGSFTLYVDSDGKQYIDAQEYYSTF